MDIIEGLTRPEQIHGPHGEENKANIQNIRQFISAVELTIPSGPSKDFQMHDGTARVHGRITIPILSQNATFSENNKNWNALQAFTPTLEKFICIASMSLMKSLEINHPATQGRTQNDYEAALEICQRALPAGQKAMLFSDKIRRVNCFSHVRISANVSMGNPWEKLAPDTDTRACGPWVVIVPWEHGTSLVTGLMGKDSYSQWHRYGIETRRLLTPAERNYFMPHIPEHNGERFEDVAELAKVLETECPETVVDSVAF
ncbi:hypothetical protein H4I96_08981 [Botrytis cinerea]